VDWGGNIPPRGIRVRVKSLSERWADGYYSQGGDGALAAAVAGALAALRLDACCPRLPAVRGTVRRSRPDWNLGSYLLGPRAWERMAPTLLVSVSLTIRNDVAGGSVRTGPGGGEINRPNKWIFRSLESEHTTTRPLPR